MIKPQVGFQPRTTPAERRAFFDQQRRYARLQRQLEQLEQSLLEPVGDTVTEDPSGSGLYFYSGTLIEDPLGSDLYYTTPETMIEDPSGSGLYRLE